MKVFIAAHYNLNNGDRAVLEATVEALIENLSSCEITVSAYKPEILYDKRFNVVPWAIKRGITEKLFMKMSKWSFFRDFFRRNYSWLCNKTYFDAILDADLVLVSGGHHLTDILSEAGYYKLSINFFVPLALKKRVILLPQSIGPAISTDIQKSIKDILEKADSVAIRDEQSLRFINSLGIKCRYFYVPDLVYKITPSLETLKEPNTVGITFYQGYVGSKRKRLFSFTIENLTMAINELINKEYNIKIIPMDDGDVELANRIYKNLSTNKKDKHYHVSPKGGSIHDLIDEFSSVSFVLAYKTHSTIFSMICNTPMIAIAYHSKTKDFMESMGLAEYAITDEEASYEKIMYLIKRLEDNIEEIKEKEKTGVIENRERIDRYMQEILK